MKMDAGQIRNVILAEAENISVSKSQDDATDEVLSMLKRKYPRESWYSAKGADSARYIALTSRMGSWILVKAGANWNVVKRS